MKSLAYFAAMKITDKEMMISILMDDNFLKSNFEAEEESPDQIVVNIESKFGDMLFDYEQQMERLSREIEVKTVLIGKIKSEKKQDEKRLTKLNDEKDSYLKNLSILESEIGRLKKMFGNEEKNKSQTSSLQIELDFIQEESEENNQIETDDIREGRIINWALLWNVVDKKAKQLFDFLVRLINKANWVLVGVNILFSIFYLLNAALNLSNTENFYVIGVLPFLYLAHTSKIVKRYRWFISPIINSVILLINITFILGNFDAIGLNIEELKSLYFTNTND